MRHDPAITRAVLVVGVDYRVCCTCGVCGPWRVAREDAVADRDDHLGEVAAPHAERCRAFPAHTRGWWEACPLCRDQGVLFSLPYPGSGAV